MPEKNEFEILESGAIHKRFDIGEIKLPAQSSDAPGMISAMERRMLYFCASREYRGDGAIIDGGSFFGSSIAASASGLLANPNLGSMNFSSFPEAKPIHGYELGFLPAPKSDKVDPHRVFNGTPYKLGDSFVPILEKTVAPYSDYVSLNIGDLLDFKWYGTPIEICFIDVCKTGKLNQHVSKEFYPSLTPGESTLINQDFFFDRLPWIKVTMGYLSEYFKWEGQVHTSSIYANIKEVPQDVACYDPYTEGTLEECLAYHDNHPKEFLEPTYHYFMGLSKAYLMALKNTKDDALDYLNVLETEYEHLLKDEHTDRGNQFRLDRARRQITNGNIFKVS